MNIPGESEDCFTARQTALERQKLGNIYVPVCTADNTYKEQQCHLEICWCVAVKNGKPIQGSRSSSYLSSPFPF